MHPILLAMGKGAAQIDAPWDNLSVAHPTDTDTTSAQTITFGGGSRTCTVVENSAVLTFEYDLDGAGFAAYAGGFSITSGQTLDWRGTFTGNTAGAITCNVYIDGVLLDSFTATATGFP